ncbi:MAG: hypothetical protein P4L50_20225 [Anaerolineaceae bacterium]|nr:hypothetical protein [Anaerolineaceae bacterium]
MIPNAMLILLAVLSISAGSFAKFTIADMRKLMDPCLTQLSILSPHAPLLSCLDVGAHATWEFVTKRLLEVDWHNNTILARRVRGLATGLIGALIFMARCADGNESLRDTRVRLELRNTDRVWIENRTAANLAAVVAQLKDYIAAWIAEDYVRAGNISGKFTQWFYLSVTATSVRS